VVAFEGQAETGAIALALGIGSAVFSFPVSDGSTRNRGMLKPLKCAGILFSAALIRWCRRLLVAFCGVLSRRSHRCLDGNCPLSPCS